MDQRLSLRHVQKLVLTPTLQQAIKLLQLSKLELIEHIRQELDENPILDEVAAENSTLASQEVPASAREKEPEPPTTDPPPDSPYKVELDWESYAHHDSREGTVAEDDSREEVWYENVLSTKESLQDHLLWQLHLTVDGEEDTGIGEELIGNIDEDGYLRAPVEEIAALLSVESQRVERVLGVIQAFDPPGIGARTLLECLLIQLRTLPVRDPVAEAIVRDHLKKLENKNVLQLSQALKKPLAEIQRAAQVIAGLEPKPGRLFSTEEPQYIIPDIFIVKDGGEFRVVLNDEGLPRLRISSYYRRLMGDASLPIATREYLQKKYSSALWLVKSIHQRQKTIYRVAESIVRHQREFLEHGIARLRPMVLRNVAEDLGIHESTVSRVTTRKYAQTPQGLYELKFFFNTGIDQDAGSAMASASVQNLIGQMVAAESQSKPLSDQEIARVLKEDYGLIIARRTVAKYRKILKILSASKRKKIVPAKRHSPAKEENLRCI